MSVSTFINYRSKDDIYQIIADYLAKGYVTVDLEKLTFIQGTQEYSLQNGNIISINSIEGIGDDGHIIPPSGTFNGVSSLVEGSDYTLTRTSVNTDEYGVDLYDKIKFTDSQLFENNSTVYISYTYYDPNRVSSITNFSTGSVISMLTKAIATELSNLYSINERLYNAGSVATAIGDDLDNHGEIWGITRDEGSPASGTVLVTISSSGSDLSVTTTTAFVASLAGENLVFTPTVGGTVSAGTSVEFDVVSVNNGYKYNVGSNSISRIYSSVDLSSELTDQYTTVTNNPLKLDGSSNLFSGGTNRETDEEYRNRIYLQSQKVGRGTKDSIKSAVENLDIVSSVRIINFDDNKDISNGIFYVQAVGNTGYKLLTDTASTTKINQVVDDYKPIGHSYGLQHPMAVMIKLSGTVIIDDLNYPNNSTIVSSVKSKLTEYINNLGLGEDVLYSELVSKAMSVGGVYDFVIDDFEYTEFASNPLYLNTSSYRISDNESGSGTTYTVYYQDIKFMSHGRTDTITYSGSNTFTTQYTPVVDSPTPSVYLAIDDGTGNYIRDPAYSIDWYQSNSTSGVTINSGAGNSLNRVLVSGVDKLNIYYETADTDTINGIRVKLHGEFNSGTTSGTVKVEIWSGVSSPASGTILESGTITVLSGTDDYEVTFSTPLTVGDAEKTYYVVLSGTSSLASGSYISLPVSSSGTVGAQNTSLYSGSSTDLSSGTMTVIPNATSMLHTRIINSGISNVDIEGNASIPDIAVIYSIDIGSTIKTEE